MSAVLSQLVKLLELEKLEENLFRGQSQDLGWGLVFGGQVLGQALSAATQTVEEERVVHSLHSYFLRPGMADAPVVYNVDRTRDGSSFTTRRVVAIQHGKPIFHMSASFQREQEGFSHQSEAPKVAGPEGLKSEREHWMALKDQIPQVFHSRIDGERPIEIRHVDWINPLQPEVAAPRKSVWIRASGPLGENPALHRYLLAYSSDFGLVTTAMRPHGATWIDPKMHVASIDHTMWFHRPFRMDEWLLHTMESPSASGARGLARSQIFDRDGVLVASCVQEGLIRRRG